MWKGAPTGRLGTKQVMMGVSTGNGVWIKRDSGARWQLTRNSWSGTLGSLGPVGKRRTSQSWNRMANGSVKRLVHNGASVYVCV